MPAKRHTQPRMIVEELGELNIPKAKPDDKFIRERNNLPPVDNPPSPGIKTGVDDDGNEQVVFDDAGNYIELNI